MDTRLDVRGDPASDAFAIDALRRAQELLAEARERGGRVHDQGDFLARALDGIYKQAALPGPAGGPEGGTG